MAMTFKELSTLMIRDFPYPIASLFQKYNKIPTDNHSVRHNQLCDIFESTLKLLAIVLMKEAVKNHKLKRCFPQGVDFMKHPSLGHWRMIIREIVKNKSDDSSTWTHKVAEWLGGTGPSQEILQYYTSLPEISFPKGNAQVDGILNSLVTYRNQVWKGHGVAVIGEDGIEGRVNALENLFAIIFSTAAFFQEMNFFFVREVKKVGKKKHEANCTSLIGANMDFAKYVYDDFEPNEIYLAATRDTELPEAPLLISPLAEMQMSNNNLQFYIFNDAKRSKLQYLSYEDGSFYYFKEVKSELEKLIKLELKKSSSDFEEKLLHYTQEEREARATQEYKKGLQLAMNGKHEGAILAFEDAIEWAQKPEYFLELCRSMDAAGDNAAYILENLEYVFEADPKNRDARELEKRLLERVDKEKTEAKSDESDLKIDLRELNVTYFHLLTPLKLRNVSALFWILAIVSFFGGASILLFLLDPANAGEHITISTFFMVASMILILGIMNATHKFSESYFSLWGQIENMKIGSFNKWFQENSKNIFGNFHLERRGTDDLSEFKRGDLSKYRIRIDLKKERIVLILMALFVLTFTGNNIPIQRLFEYKLPVAVVRFIITTAYWLLIAPLLRYLVGYVRFIKEYSNLELTPVISRMGTNGFKSIIQLFTQSLVLLNFFWILNWGWNAIASRDPMYIDFLGLGFALIVVVFYIVFAPLFIGRALRISKSMVILDYKGHIKQAFKKFVKDPSKDKIETLEWLINNEGRVRRVSSQLFSFWQWVFVAFTVLLVLGVSVFYVLIRLGVMKPVSDFLTSL